MKGGNYIKKILAIILSCILISTIILGCSSSVNSKSITKEIFTQYKTQLYNVSDYSKFNKVYSNMDETIRYIEGFKVYMTEEGFKRFAANRICTMPLEACDKGKFTLRMTSMKLNKITEEDNKILIEYEVKLQASYPEANKTETAVETGEMALIKENDAWKIDHDWFRVADLLEQAMGFGQGAIMKF